jgi:site-specific DNA-methyltransferase (adenine-specific)
MQRLRLARMILIGDVRTSLKNLADGSVQCVVTSPPYWGLRDYGRDDQIGLEATPELYVSALVSVFNDVRRVLRDDGTLWLNLGDSYAGNNSRASNNGRAGYGNAREGVFERIGDGLKTKDLVGIPWRVAFALQADGWYLRQDIIWHKPNPLPESVKDRCTKAHEYIFLLSKSSRYYFDYEAIKEPTVNSLDKRNRRDVWTVPVKPFKGAHFATFPESLITPCILAGCPEGGVVLDPFFGAGTTGLVAQKNNRKWIGCELNADYARIAENRIINDKNIFQEES